MRLDIPYGQGFLNIELPSYSRVEQFVPPSMPKLADLSSSFSESIVKSSFAGNDGSKNFVIVLDYPETSHYCMTLLHSLLEHMQVMGYSHEAGKVILSTNRYREPQVKNCLDVAISFGMEIITHRDDDPKMFTEVGTTPTNGTTVFLNKEYLEADLKIVVGRVYPHLFYGASGGPASLVYGLSSKSTKMQNEKLSIQNECAQFDFETVMFKDMFESYNLAKPTYSINLVCDWIGTPVALHSGEGYAAWTNAISSSIDATAKIRPPKLDVVIVSAGGSFWDYTFYDAVSALRTAAAITRVGGTIFLIAECSDGLGPDGFLQGFSLLESIDDIHAITKNHYDYGMSRAIYTHKLVESKQVILCSRMRESLVEEKLGFTPVHDPQEGVKIILDKMGSKARFGYIANGNMILV